MQGKILNRFGLAFMHLPMLVDAFNKDKHVPDGIFGDLKMWKRILFNSGFSSWEFSWYDIKIEYCKYTKSFKYYLYTFPEPQKLSQAKFGIVVICGREDDRNARYFTLETSMSFNLEEAEANKCYALCEPQGTRHTYISQFQGDGSKNDFVSAIYNRFYTHITPSLIEKITRRCSIFDRENVNTGIYKLTPIPHLVVFADNVFNKIKEALKKSPDIMTGGFFLGYILNNKYWIVVDNVDSGPKTIADKDTWEYDSEYVNIEVNKRVASYPVQLSLLGLWVYYPNGLMYHSSVSDETNYQFANLNTFGCLCGIATAKGGFKFRLQHLDSNRVPNSNMEDSGYTDIKFEVGEEKINKLLDSK